MASQKSRKSSRKRTKHNGDKQSTRYRVQNTGYKMLIELKGRADELSMKKDHKKEPVRNE